MQEASRIAILPDGIMARREVLNRLMTEMTPHEQRFFHSRLAEVDHSCDIIISLPAELSIRTLGYLDPVDICNLRRVSRAWASLLDSPQLLWALIRINFPGECPTISHEQNPKDIFSRKSKRWLSFSTGRPYRSAIITYTAPDSLYERIFTLNGVHYKAGRIAWIEFRQDIYARLEDNASVVRLYDIASGMFNTVGSIDRESIVAMFLSESLLVFLTANKRCSIVQLGQRSQRRMIRTIRLPEAQGYRPKVWCDDRAVYIRYDHFDGHRLVHFHYWHDIRRNITRKIEPGNPRTPDNSLYIQERRTPFPIAALRLSTLEDVLNTDLSEVRFATTRGLRLQPNCKSDSYSKECSEALDCLGREDEDAEADNEARYEICRYPVRLANRAFYASDFNGTTTLWSSSKVSDPSELLQRSLDNTAERRLQIGLKYFYQMKPGDDRITTIMARGTVCADHSSFRESPDPYSTQDEESYNHMEESDCPIEVAEKQRLLDPYVENRLSSFMLWKSCIYQLGTKRKTEIFVQNIVDKTIPPLCESWSEISQIEENDDSEQIEDNHHFEPPEYFCPYEVLGDENILVHVRGDGLFIYSFNEDSPLPNENQRYYERRVQLAEERKQLRARSRNE